MKFEYAQVDGKKQKTGVINCGCGYVEVERRGRWRSVRSAWRRPYRHRSSGRPSVLAVYLLFTEQSHFLSARTCE